MKQCGDWESLQEIPSEDGRGDDNAGCGKRIRLGQQDRGTVLWRSFFCAVGRSAPVCK